MKQDNIGNLIKKKRLEKGLTQKELAYNLHVSVKTISKWECGRGVPDSGIMIDLCNLLEITVEELLTGKINKHQYTYRSEYQNKKKMMVDNAFKKIVNNVDLIQKEIMLIKNVTDTQKRCTIDVIVSGMEIIKGHTNAYAYIEVKDESGVMSALIVDTGDKDFKNIIKNLAIGDRYIMAGKITINEEVCGDKVMIVQGIRKVV